MSCRRYIGDSLQKSTAPKLARLLCDHVESSLRSAKDTSMIHRMVHHPNRSKKFCYSEILLCYIFYMYITLLLEFILDLHIISEYMREYIGTRYIRIMRLIHLSLSVEILLAENIVRQILPKGNIAVLYL